LLAVAFALSQPLPAPFRAGLAAYVAVAFAYSLWLKAFVLVDVFTLAGLYAVRILAGAAAIAVPVSHWLLVFSLFMFLSLALAKRYAELSAHPGWALYGRKVPSFDEILAQLEREGPAEAYASAMRLAISARPSNSNPTMPTPITNVPRRRLR